MTNIDACLREVLLPYGLEIETPIYRGTANKYITYNYTTVPESFGDDAPEREKYLIQIHLVTSLNDNIHAMVRSIKKALSEADFSYPESCDISSADERHIVLETEAHGEIDYGTI